jgi:phage protein U
MFASFGTISFEVLASPMKWEQEQKFSYAKVDVVGAPPILQWIFDDLQKISLTIQLHQLWCNPAGAIQQFYALAQTHAAQNFVLGNGTNVGQYVIERLQPKMEWFGDNGYLVQARLEIDLLQYVGSALPQGAPPADATALGVPAPGLSNPQFVQPGSVIATAPASAAPDGIPFNSGGYQAVPLETVARAGN